MPKASDIQTMMFRIPSRMDFGATLYRVSMPEKWDTLFEGLWPSPSRRGGGRVPYASLGDSLRLLFPSIAHIERMNWNLTYGWLSCWERPGGEQFMALVEAWIANSARGKDTDSVINRIHWDDLEWTSQELSFGEYGFHENCSPLLDPIQYECLPDLMCAELAGRETQMGDRSLVFRRAYDGRRPCLISWPAIESPIGKSSWYWSYVLTPRILNFPGCEAPILSLSASVRRWASKSLRGRSGYYNLSARENTTVYVEALSPWFAGRSNDRGHNLVGIPMKLRAGQEDGDTVWKPGWEGSVDRILNRLAHPLPDADELSGDPARFLNRELGSAGITLRASDTSHRVTTGVPLLDRRDIFTGVSETLEPFGFELAEVSERVRLQGVRRQSPLRSKKFTDIPGSPIVQSLRRAIGDRVKFEVLYQTEAMRQALRSEIWERLLNEESSTIPHSDSIHLGGVHVEVGFTELGALGGELERSGRIGEDQRIEEIRNTMDRGDSPIGCLVELHSDDDFPPGKDPKAAIRRGLAARGRLSQFITPTSSDERSGNRAERVRNAVADILRQMGNMPAAPFDEMYPRSGFPEDLQIMGVWILHKDRRARFPVLVHVASRSQVEEGFSPVGVMLPTGVRGGERYSYPEAQLRIGSGEVADVPMDRIPSVLKRMLGEFAESVGADDIPTLILFDALNVRRFWPESQNRNLTVGSGVGMPWDTGGLRPRVARTHASGYEMPQWFEESLRWSSGLFRGLGDNAYFSIGPKSAAMKSGSQKSSKRDRPHDRHTLSRANEIVLVQLREGDDPDVWAGAIHRLREMASHYNYVLEYPLPLHLAMKTEEYVPQFPERGKESRGR